MVPQELLSMCVTGQSGPRLASVWCPPFRASPPLTTCSPLVWRNQKTCFANLRLLIWPDAGFCSFGWPRLVSVCQLGHQARNLPDATRNRVSLIWPFCRSNPDGVNWVSPLRFPPLELISCGVAPPVLPHLLLLLFLRFDPWTPKEFILSVLDSAKAARSLSVDAKNIESLIEEKFQRTMGLLMGTWLHFVA